MKLPVKDIVFFKEVPNVHHENSREGMVQRLQYDQPKPFTVDDEGGWLKITGFKRTVWVSRSNVAFMLVDEAEMAQAAKGKK